MARANIIQIHQKYTQLFWKKNGKIVIITASLVVTLKFLSISRCEKLQLLFYFSSISQYGEKFCNEANFCEYTTLFVAD